MEVSRAFMGYLRDIATEISSRALQIFFFFFFFLPCGICAQCRNWRRKSLSILSFPKLRSSEIRDRARNFTHVRASLLWFCFRRFARKCCSFVLQCCLSCNLLRGKVSQFLIHFFRPRRLSIGKPICRGLAIENTSSDVWNNVLAARIYRLLVLCHKFDT